MEERSACAKFAQKTDNGKDLKALRFLAYDAIIEDITNNSIYF